MSFDIGKALASVAPTIASMLAGPFAGTAIASLENALGLAPGSGADGITKVLQTGAMTPDMIAAVRAADQHHAEVLGQQNINLAKLNADAAAAQDTVAAADRDSARKMQIAKPSPWPGFLSCVLTLSVLMLAVARYIGVHVPDDPLTTRVVDALLSGWMLSIAYWFGTTRSSTEKTNLLAQSSPNGAPVMAVSSTTGNTTP